MLALRIGRAISTTLTALAEIAIGAILDLGAPTADLGPGLARLVRTHARPGPGATIS